MSTPLRKIIQAAAYLLGDGLLVRWKVSELVEWVNAGQDEAAMRRPDTVGVTATLTLALGARQTLPALIEGRTPLKLMDIRRNVAPTSLKRAVRLVSREALDAATPEWMSDRTSINVQNYTFDPREPLVYYVYPPATAATQVEAFCALRPLALPIPAPGTLISALTGDIGIIDLQANALLDYVLYRAFSKNADTSDAARAARHMGAFIDALTVELTTTLVGQPQAPGTTVTPG